MTALLSESLSVIHRMYLQKFRWWSSLRPEREWYGDRLHWADNLGEVPDILEQYFLAPSDFGEPKSFSGTRFIAPKTSLPLADDIPAIEGIAPDSIATLLPGDDSLRQLEESDSISMNNADKTVEEGNAVEENVSKEEEETSSKETEQQSSLIKENIIKKEDRE